MAAGMIDAYYSIGCDSKEMFASFNIAKDPEFEKHLNKYHVLHFYMDSFLNKGENADQTVSFLNTALIKDMREAYPEALDYTLDNY